MIIYCCLIINIIIMYALWNIAKYWQLNTADDLTLLRHAESWFSWNGDSDNSIEQDDSVIISKQIFNRLTIYETLIRTGKLSMVCLILLPTELVLSNTCTQMYLFNVRFSAEPYFTSFLLLSAFIPCASMINLGLKTCAPRNFMLRLPSVSFPSCV